VRDKGLPVFSLWSPRFPTLEVDLFAREPSPFAEVHARALKVSLEHTIAWVVSLQELIAIKTQAGRQRDLEDVEALRALEGDEWSMGE
jgi:hypothetical protein